MFFELRSRGRTLRFSAETIFVTFSGFLSARLRTKEYVAFKKENTQLYTGILDFELGRLYSRMNRTEEGRLHFDLVLS